MTRRRGADLLVATLRNAGIETIFSLSGNQIMPVYDACVDAGIRIVHTRHEAAAVYMAEAWAQLTGRPGIALVTAGPGLANALSPLFSARASESPVILLSGDAPLDRPGAFQELPQPEIAGTITKAAWRARSADHIGLDIARAIRLSLTGRPGPVQIALPFDVLNAPTDIDPPPAAVFDRYQVPTAVGDIASVVEAITAASRPVIVTGPALSRARQAEVLDLLAATGTPVVPLESPRGLKDPSLGSFAEILPQADLIVALGKPIDFMLGFAQPPAVAKGCRVVHVDPDEPMLERSRRGLGDRLLLALQGDTLATAKGIGAAAANGHRSSAWSDEIARAIAARPVEWRGIVSSDTGPIHPAELFRAVQQRIDRAGDAIIVLDGGEIGQWAQACLSGAKRIINGPSGAIGGSLPYAVAAQLAAPDATVIAVMGDGTAGFYFAECETAARLELPIRVILGNDARWNAEYMIQVRDYGENRALGCEMRRSRYDLAAAGFGWHGEQVSRPDELEPALDRAMRSRAPAMLDVTIEGLAAPSLTAAASPH